MKPKIKKILTTATLVLLGGYIVFAAIAVCRRPAGEVCQGVRLEIRDSLDTGYMSTKDIGKLLSQSHLDPTGLPLDEVDLRTIEETLESAPLIAACECYKTLDGYVVVKAECRKPILRIMAEGGDSYYIDETGEVIEHISQAVYVPVATGAISRRFAQEHLTALASYIGDNEFWDAQIEQIHVTALGEIELIPRVGDHVIALGRPTDYAQKFDKLQTFYAKGLSETGWDRYSRICIDYAGQVVATKRQP